MSYVGNPIIFLQIGNILITLIQIPNLPVTLLHISSLITILHIDNSRVTLLSIVILRFKRYRISMLVALVQSSLLDI
jgi:hypothetical protein